MDSAGSTQNAPVLEIVRVAVLVVVRNEELIPRLESLKGHFRGAELSVMSIAGQIPYSAFDLALFDCNFGEISRAQLVLEAGLANGNITHATTTLPDFENPGSIETFIRVVHEHIRSTCLSWAW